MRLRLGCMGRQRFLLLMLMCFLLWSLCLLMFLYYIPSSKNYSTLDAHSYKSEFDDDFHFAPAELDRNSLALISDLNKMEKRLEILEAQLRVLSLANSSLKTHFYESMQDAKNIVNGLKVKERERMEREKICMLAANSSQQYPNCLSKVAYMHNAWSSHDCYADHGVDGSDCSILRYLSEVEQFCPLLPWRQKEITETITKAAEQFVEAMPQFDLKNLFDSVLIDDVANYVWIKNRIGNMWDRWKKAYQNLSSKFDMKRRAKKKILLHMGLLTKTSKLHWSEKIAAGSGAPLGELVQWSDLIASLYILGHELHVSSQMETLKNLLFLDKTQLAPCPSRLRFMDIIYLDIIGLNQMKKLTKGGFLKYSCTVRVLDSFGTEPQFNSKVYATSHKLKTQWGKHDLMPKQFYTMYPHTPDNSFMGFVVDVADPSSISTRPRNKTALIYGKEAYMWEGFKSYINVIHEFANIHATVSVDKSTVVKLPEYVKNHGILSSKELQKLLQETKLFVGLGFPYEGPAPLEAIASGCIFINPKFIPPKNRENTKFFADKPTFRALTSQNPYVEVHIGNPHVFTPNIRNVSELRDVLREALATKVFPYLPYEFQMEGMLQRVSILTEKQDFCRDNAGIWPPKEALQVVFSLSQESCVDACAKRKLICEPSFFPLVNSVKALMNLGINCSHAVFEENIFHPSVDESQCFLQKQKLLFSCAGAVQHAKRICPCRDFVKGQTVLCSLCF